MQLYVLPISGGYFPHQLAVLEWLASCSIIPDLVLGSSGGNVSAYIGMAGNWTSNGMRSIIPYMSSKIFIQSWWPTFLFYLPTILKGYFVGSVYNMNPKFLNFFAALFQACSIKRTEIWTGTNNITRDMNQLFCNLSSGESRLTYSCTNGSLLNYLPNIYLDGDIPTLAKACFASAAVPTVFPPIQIGNDYYTDGGSNYASPMCPLKDSLRPVIARESSTHIYFIAPYNIDSTKTDFCYPMMDGGIDKMNLGSNKTVQGSIYFNGRKALNSLIRTLYLQDRIAGLELLNEANLTYDEKIVTLEDFKTLVVSLQKCRKSFLECYPLNDQRISITSFTGQNILDIMDNQVNLGVRYWKTCD